ncbi:MAG: pyridoxal-dependent decarboxylase [Solirubrobacteraceae bacterium]|nr:pyridoxal-dependent decarboxylase [Solirubrobacteraceae bacterium]
MSASRNGLPKRPAADVGETTAEVVEAAPDFLTADPRSHAQLRRVALATADAVAAARLQDQPFSGADPAQLAAAIATIDPCPDDGVALDELLAQLRDAVLAHGVHVSDPRCAAHLHCPTLLTAAAAELAIGVTNQSLDSYDQAPAATLVEDHLVRWLAATLGLSGGSGVLTSGGTASNLLGLLLARERAGARAAAHGAGVGGLPPEHVRWRIVASAAAHDSIRRCAAVLGLGTGCVTAVATDDAGRIDLGALDAELAALASAGLEPIAIVATAGTTDLGAIDPLAPIAERARACGAWLHVDAALGSGLALSPRLAPLLDGIELADSITADLHKLWFMPIGASALLVRDVALLAAVHHHSDYLNRPEDEVDGVLNLVGRSLDTSRRFDALKILVGLRSTGRLRMAAMVERLVALAAGAARAVDAHDELELLAEPSTVTVVFRWRPGGGEAPLPDDLIDAVNVAAQRALLRSGRAIVGRTRLHGRVALKLTFVNPLARESDVGELLDLVAEAGRAAARAGVAVR